MDEADAPDAEAAAAEAARPRPLTPRPLPPRPMPARRTRPTARPDALSTTAHDPGPSGRRPIREVSGAGPCASASTSDTTAPGSRGGPRSRAAHRRRASSRRASRRCCGPRRPPSRWSWPGAPTPASTPPARCVMWTCPAMPGTHCRAVVTSRPRTRWCAGSAGSCRPTCGSPVRPSPPPASTRASRRCAAGTPTGSATTPRACRRCAGATSWPGDARSTSGSWTPPAPR